MNTKLWHSCHALLNIKHTTLPESQVTSRKQSKALQMDVLISLHTSPCFLRIFITRIPIVTINPIMGGPSPLINPFNSTAASIIPKSTKQIRWKPFACIAIEEREHIRKCRHWCTTVHSFIYHFPQTEHTLFQSRFQGDIVEQVEQIWFFMESLFHFSQEVAEKKHIMRTMSSPCKKKTIGNYSTISI